jgi:hypothetical protein
LECQSHIYVNYGTGSDNENCGSETQPCKTIHYGIGRALPTQEVRLIYSAESFPQSMYIFPQKVFNVYGQGTETDSGLVYPQLLMNFTEISCFNFSLVSQGTLNCLQVLINASAMQYSRFFFCQYSSGDNALINLQYDNYFIF